MKIKENFEFWSNYNWERAGNEWSDPWGCPSSQWRTSIFPRVENMLFGSVLEIAPGFGRWTGMLKNHCDSLVAVDLCPRCVNHCKQLFKDVDLYVNDGRSLPFVGDSTIDLVFSFDSLVHCELDTIQSYLKEFNRVMKPDAFGFIHHSNMAQIDWKRPNGRRARTVGAALVKRACEEVGLYCFKQEVVNWQFNMYNDCFTTFSKAPREDYEIIENWDFMLEARPYKVFL